MAKFSILGHLADNFSRHIIGPIRFKLLVNDNDYIKLVDDTTVASVSEDPYDNYL